jgi:type I restriction enzyme S subunit
MTQEHLGNTKLPYPPFPEQCAIAAFLDERTSRIDGLIDRKKRLGQLLKERRQALIIRAVTRGLDPNVKLKPSGVPWLGEVPVGWEVKRLKHISQFVTSGSRGWAEHYADEGAVFIRIGNLDRLSIDLRLDDIQRVDPPTSAEVIRTRAMKNDLLISITAFLGTVGIVPDGLGEAYVNQHTALVRLSKDICNPRFVAYWLFSSPAQQQFKGASEGGTKEGMNLQEVRDLAILQPEVEEQRRIADHLDEALLRIDTLATKVEAAVERLQEYRSALISAAVTGKLRVPESESVTYQ